MLDLVVILGRAAVDGGDFQQSRSLTTHAGADLADDLHPFPQVVLLHQRTGDERVGIDRPEVVGRGAQKAVLLGMEFEHAFEHAAHHRRFVRGTDGRLLVPAAVLLAIAAVLAMTAAPAAAMSLIATPVATPAAALLVVAAAVRLLLLVASSARASAGLIALSPSATATAAAALRAPVVLAAGLIVAAAWGVGLAFPSGGFGPDRFGVILGGTFLDGGAFLGRFVGDDVGSEVVIAGKLLGLASPRRAAGPRGRFLGGGRRCVVVVPEVDGGQFGLAIKLFDHRRLGSARLASGRAAG